MSLYRILCTTSPAWLVGEDEKDAIPRRLLRDTSSPGETYPGDPAGKIISVIPYKKTYHAKDLAATIRREVILDLSDADLARARSGEYKVPPETSALADVTFEDKYGATAAGLLRFDARATVTSEDDERASIDAVHKANDTTRLLYEGAMEQWKYDYPIAFISGTPLPEKPSAPVYEVVPESVFSIEAVRLRRKLPKTIVHSGAGLYEVKSGEYATIQSALDQLWTDQGATAFAANQYIRIFADQSPYDEAVTPNASLNQDEANGYTLVIEGDPDDDRANCHISLTAAAYVLTINCDGAHVRHLKTTASASSGSVRFQSGVTSTPIIEDCEITGGHASVPVLDCVHGLLVLDCAIVSAGNGVNQSSTSGSRSGLRIVSSTITKSGAVAGYGIQVVTGGFSMVGSAVSGFARGLDFAVSVAIGDIRNSDFYNNDEAIEISQGLGHNLDLVNVIFKDNTVNIDSSGVPDEASGLAFCGPYSLRNCYFHGYTTFATAGGNNKTYAQFIAYDRVDADANVDGVDPLLTDPGSGDFSLEAGSPCLAPAGHGSGVITGYNGVAFNDPPDIGAWSSGVIASTTAPTWTDNLSNITATDAAADSEVDLTWDAASQAQSKNIGYIAEYRTTAGPGAWTEAERSNDTSLTVSGLTNDTGYDFRVKAYARVETEPTTTPSDTASATPTGTAAPSQITIAATDQEDGDSIVVAVTGATGVTARVYYRLRGQDDWLGSSEREGNGNVTFTGLFSGNEYAFSGVGVSDGIVSIPSDPAFAWCTSGSAIRAEIRVALGQRLYLDSTLANLISSRVYYVRPPQAIEYPCVTFHVAEDNPQMLVDEYGKVDFMIQIDVWSQGDDKMETLDKIVDAIDNLLTDWRVDTTNWLGLRLRRTAGPLRVELKGKQQRAMMWALTAGRKGT